MVFYYTSVLSIVPLGIAYAIAALVYGFIWWLSGDATRRILIRLVAAIVLLLLPVSEELWIAWNFGQACKEAGAFISKKVQVDGFYDDTRTTHAGKPTPQAVESFEKGGYRFYEMKGSNGGVVHIEKSDGQWNATMLDRPRARYHYQSRDHIPQATKVVKHESVVVDTQERQILGRETIFGRYAPWFFIGHDAPQMQCYGMRDVKGLIYQNVLPPKK